MIWEEIFDAYVNHVPHPYMILKMSEIFNDNSKLVNTKVKPSHLKQSIPLIFEQIPRIINDNDRIIDAFSFLLHIVTKKNPKMNECQFIRQLPFIISLFSQHLVYGESMIDDDINSKLPEWILELTISKPFVGLELFCRLSKLYLKTVSPVYPLVWYNNVCTSILNVHSTYPSALKPLFLVLHDIIIATKNYSYFCFASIFDFFRPIFELALEQSFYLLDTLSCPQMEAFVPLFQNFFIDKIKHVVNTNFSSHNTFELVKIFQMFDQTLIKYCFNPFGYPNSIDTAMKIISTLLIVEMRKRVICQLQITAKKLIDYEPSWSPLLAYLGASSPVDVKFFTLFNRRDQPIWKENPQTVCCDLWNGEMEVMEHRNTDDIRKDFTQDDQSTESKSEIKEIFKEKDIQREYEDLEEIEKNQNISKIDLCIEESSQLSHSTNENVSGNFEEEIIEAVVSTQVEPQSDTNLNNVVVEEFISAKKMDDGIDNLLSDMPDFL
eukprot:TRINITY_DN3115_c2_g6_i1.p1 TRINITY_DN3115_c2_g6~~TRINITY_DN3115_c2_g6_i1.p1  ORF type:complete len:493 (+),score=136.76 TRINITY_DN3115_c2_g6_i1:56-1534(+)